MANVKDRLEQIKMRNLKVKHRKYQVWPIEKKIEVVSQWLVLGNMKLVAATTGVGYDLIREWKTQPWWKELEMEIRQTQNIEMDTKLSKIVERSMEAVADRLEHGDHFYDQKTGEIKRKPVAMRDAARVTVDLLSKRELLRGNATERRETTQVSVAEQLKMLAAEFAKWQNPNKEIVVDVTDVEAKEDIEDAEFTTMVEYSGESGEDETLPIEMETGEQGSREDPSGEEESPLSRN